VQTFAKPKSSFTLLEQGKVELKARDFSKILADQQKLIDYAKQYEDQLKRDQQVQASQSTASSGTETFCASGDDGF